MDRRNTCLYYEKFNNRMNRFEKDCFAEKKMN